MSTKEFVKETINSLYKESKFYEKLWWGIKNFIDDWIYPAHFLKNYLFHRHDLIKLPIKPYEYVDTMYKVEEGNFELLREFIEDEKPEKYICWYKDSNGEDYGHRYGEGNRKILFPELKGKYVMDILKDIYNFYKNELPQLRNDHSYLLNIWCDYIHNGYWKECENNDLLEWVHKETIWNFEKLKNENIKWDIVEKYIKKENFFEKNELHNAIHKLENDIQEKITYNLHLFIELREYLWT